MHFGCATMYDDPPTPTAETVLNTYLPFGWHLTHLIREANADASAFCWIAIATDDEHVATASGKSIEWAIASTADNVLAEQFVGRIFDGISSQAQPAPDLSFLRPKLPTITRRL